MPDRALLAVLAATLLVPVLATPIAAQAWVQPVGGYYVKISASYLRTDEQYDVRGDIEPMAAGDTTSSGQSFRDVTLSAYLEYGLTERYTMVASLPFKISTTENTETPQALGDPPQTTTLTNGGLADFWLSIRARLWQSSTAIAFQAGVKLPLGYEQTPDNGGPALGTGAADAEASLLFGQSFYPFPAYIAAGLGYRFRGGQDFDDEVTYSIEGGYTAGALFMKLRFDGLENVGGLPEPGASASSSAGGMEQPNARNEDRYQISPIVAYDMSDTVALTAEVFHVIGGKNTIAGTTWSLGAVFSPR